MKALKNAGRAAGRHPRRVDEGGFLLVMVMIVMLVLSTIAASTLINSFLERSLAKNQNYASVALQAAAGGLAAGETWLRENRSALPDPYTTNPTWSQTLTRTLESGGAYSVTIRFKSEWRDVNGDGDCADPGESSGYTDACTTKDVDGNCISTDGDAQTPANFCVDPDGAGPLRAQGEIVLYNNCATKADNCFQFPDSLYTGVAPLLGKPVIEIDAIGTYGTGSFREIVLDLARDYVDVQVEGAITARGPITVSGSGYADGHNFNMAGTAKSALCGDKPAVTVDLGVTEPACTGAAGEDPAHSNAKGLYGGTPCTAVYDPTAPGKRALATNPWDLIGVPQSFFDAMFTKTSTANAVSGTAALPTYVWQTTDLHINGGNGYGILVVHNENFDPDTWETNCPTGIVAAHLYCNSTYGPATFFMNGNVTYTGIIIADQVLRVSGTAVTTGALISLGGTNVTGDITGNWTAKYSCEAVENALNGFGYSTKLAWHRIR